MLNNSQLVTGNSILHKLQDKDDNCVIRYQL